MIDHRMEHRVLRVTETIVKAFPSEAPTLLEPVLAKVLELVAGGNCQVGSLVGYLTLLARVAVQVSVEGESDASSWCCSLWLPVGVDAEQTPPQFFALLKRVCGGTDAAAKTALQSIFNLWLKHADHATGSCTVLLFALASLALLISFAHSLNLCCLQLHGRERPGRWP